VKGSRETSAKRTVSGRVRIFSLSPREMNSVATFLRRAHRVIGIALANVDTFETVAEFVSSVDRLKNQRGVQSST
jgi:hypothetical protein